VRRSTVPRAPALALGLPAPQRAYKGRKAKELAAPMAWARERVEERRMKRLSVAVFPHEAWAERKEPARAHQSWGRTE
jgi:hypothetical protein